MESSRSGGELATSLGRYARKGSRNLTAILSGNDLVSRLNHLREEAEKLEQQAENVIRALIRRHYEGREVPPAELRRHVGMNDSALNYWSKGISSSERVLKWFGPAPSGPVLDWGCGSGRTLLWLLHYPAWREAYHGCDVDAAAIDWLRAQGETRVQVSSDEPALDYPDGFFAGLFSFSVLTHIPPERHRAWYEELGRVLRPGALMYLTVNGRGDALDLTDAEEDEYARTGHFWLAKRGHYKHVSCVSEAFTRQCLDGLLEFEAYERGGYGPQDVVVARRPEAG